jgi:hypothetical protein
MEARHHHLFEIQRASWRKFFVFQGFSHKVCPFSDLLEHYAHQT